MINREIRDKIESDLKEEITNWSRNGILETVSGSCYFLKSSAKSQSFQCEANGLKELRKADAILIADCASVGNNYILTKFIDNGYPEGDFFNRFGKQLAQLHRYKSSSYGFYEDNFIGNNPQPNIPSQTEANDWVEFFFNKRLLYQYKLAERHNKVSDKLRKGFLYLESTIESLLRDSTEEPTLLHGDLWAGNFLCDTNNNVHLIDPAVYYGHREADLAMTKMFGGFTPAFYSSYHKEYPLQDGWEYREGIYRLYHVLNHLNLFGRSYLGQAEQILMQYM